MSLAPTRREPLACVGISPTPHVTGSFPGLYGLSKHVGFSMAGINPLYPTAIPGHWSPAFGKNRRGPAVRLFFLFLGVPNGLLLIKSLRNV